MRLLADEGVHRSIVKALREAGYDTQVNEQVAVIPAALADHAARLSNAFTVIGTTGVRIRRGSY